LWGGLWFSQARVAQHTTWFNALKEQSGVSPASIDQQALMQALQRPQNKACWIIADGLFSRYWLNQHLRGLGAAQRLVAGVTHEFTPCLIPSLGQATLAHHKGSLHALPVIGGGAYLAPIQNNSSLLGASYCAPEQFDCTDHLAGNWHRLKQMLPALAQSTQAPLTTHAGLRVGTADHLPCIGPVDNSGHCWFIGGFGSRGLLWGALAAQLLGQHVIGAPLAIEVAQLKSLLPSRLNPPHNNTP
jgi:glycine/D-amino acid oxidase-like deaminating enzyme